MIKFLKEIDDMITAWAKPLAYAFLMVSGIKFARFIITNLLAWFGIIKKVGKK